MGLKPSPIYLYIEIYPSITIYIESITQSVLAVFPPIFKVILNVR